MRQQQQTMKSDCNLASDTCTAVEQPPHMSMRYDECARLQSGKLLRQLRPCINVAHNPFLIRALTSTQRLPAACCSNMYVCAHTHACRRTCTGRKDSRPTAGAELNRTPEPAGGFANVAAKSGAKRFAKGPPSVTSFCAAAVAAHVSTAISSTAAALAMLCCILQLTCSRDLTIGHVSSRRCTGDDGRPKAVPGQSEAAATYANA